MAAKPSGPSPFFGGCQVCLGGLNVELQAAGELPLTEHPRRGSPKHQGSTRWKAHEQPARRVGPRPDGVPGRRQQRLEAVERRSRNQQQTRQNRHQHHHQGQQFTDAAAVEQALDQVAQPRRQKQVERRENHDGQGDARHGRPAA